MARPWACNDGSWVRAALGALSEQYTLITSTVIRRSQMQHQPVGKEADWASPSIAPLGPFVLLRKNEINSVLCRT